MQVFLKKIIFLFFIVSFPVIIYVVVFSQNGENAFKIVFFISSLTIVSIGTSIYGMFKGSIAFLKIRKRIGSFLLFAVSTLFLLYVIVLGIASILLENHSKGYIPSLRESFFTVANIFMPVAYKEGLLTEEFEGITIRFPEGEETSIQTIKSCYPKVKEQLDKIYGKDSTENLTIMIYESLDELDSYTNQKETSGFYTPINRCIHMVSVKQSGSSRFQDSFYHEYTHYRTDQFINQHQISSTSFPQWFNEGISEFVMNLNTFVDVDLLKVKKFTEMDTNENFHKAREVDFDPYCQSYFAVRELILEHGIDVIPKLLQSTKDNDFYLALQKETGLTIEEFQSTFLNRNEKIQELLNQAGEAEGKKQYKTAENIYLEINQLDPYSMVAARKLPYIYVKQCEFEKATIQLTAMYKQGTSDLGMLSELSLLTSPLDALKYAEEGEEEARTNFNDDSIKWEYTDAIRGINADPIKGYVLLFDKDLMAYQEIKTELLKKIKLLYPNEQRIQALE